MSTTARDRKNERGQIVVVFTLMMTAILLGVGLVIDGGYALQQFRAAQNASDFAALAGARVVALSIAGDTVNGSDSRAVSAITASMLENSAEAPTFGAPNGPMYIDTAGDFVGWVGNGSIPAGTVGVRLSSDKKWRPFFLGIAGINEWQATAHATARGGYAAGGPQGAFPAGIAQAFFDGRTPCAGSISSDPSDPCYPQHLTPGSLNVPGGFGWLKFGCEEYGLGQSGGCENSKTFLQEQIGPPPNSFGCCSQVGLPGSQDKIGSLPGNKASADCSYYIDNQILATIAVWDYAGGSGENAWYHIVGFTGFQITNCDGGKSLEGVYRQPIFMGPTTTVPGFAGQALAVQLIR
jgi:hypothetical protein